MAVDKLIITVTVDCTVSYPRHKFMPPIEDVDAVAIARAVGREIASPEEARRIIGVREHLVSSLAPIAS